MIYFKSSERNRFRILYYFSTYFVYSVFSPSIPLYTSVFFITYQYLNECGQ